MQKVSSLSKNILFLSIMAYLIVIFLPVFSVKGTLFNIMVLLSFMGFVAAVLLDGKINYLIISFLGLVIVFDFLIYKTQWVGLYSFANKMLLLFEFWFPCLVSVYMFSRHEEFSNQYRKKLVDLFLLIYAVTCITTIVGNLRYDIPSRWLATGLTGELGYLYRIQNIGGFGFCYIVLFVAGLLVYMYRATREKKYFALLVLSYACAAVTQFTVLLFLLMAETFFMAYSFISLRKKCFVLLFCVPLFCVLFLYLPEMLKSLLLLMEGNEVVQQRVKEVYDWISGIHHTGKALGNRVDVYQQSWDAFVQNPLIGCRNPEGIGGHSEILDLLGSCGLLGLCLLLGIIGCVYQGFIPMYKKLSQIGKYHVKVAVLFFLALSTVNPVFSSRELGAVFMLTFLFVSVQKPRASVGASSGYKDYREVGLEEKR